MEFPDQKGSSQFFAFENPPTPPSWRCHGLDSYVQPSGTGVPSFWQRLLYRRLTGEQMSMHLHWRNRQAKYPSLLLTEA